MLSFSQRASLAGGAFLLLCAVGRVAGCVSGPGRAAVRTSHAERRELLWGKVMWMSSEEMDGLVTIT